MRDEDLPRVVLVVKGVLQLEDADEFHFEFVSNVDSGSGRGGQEKDSGEEDGTRASGNMRPESCLGVSAHGAGISTSNRFYIH